MRRVLSLVVLVALVTSGCKGRAAQSRWERLDDIAYVLPSRVPTGWTLAFATEAPGRPFERWESQSEQYTNDARNEVIIVAATLAERGRATKPGVPRAEPDFSPPWLLGFVLGDEVEVDELKLVRTAWRSTTLDLGVLHVARRPSARLVRSVAARVEHETALGFAAPTDVAAGFTYAGSAGGEVPSYTIVFTPDRYAGKSRNEATKLIDGAPTIYIEVGAYFYTQWRSLPDFTEASVERDEDGDLSIEFGFAESSVRVRAYDVGRRELLAVAESLSRHSGDEWRKRLGDRLLTQEPH